MLQLIIKAGLLVYVMTSDGKETLHATTKGYEFVLRYSSVTTVVFIAYIRLSESSLQRSLPASLGDYEPVSEAGPGTRDGHDGSAG
jgi:hypothetical protein